MHWELHQIIMECCVSCYMVTMIRMVAGKGGECPGQRTSYHMDFLCLFIFKLLLHKYLCFLYMFVLLTYMYNLLAGNIIQFYS